MATQLCPTCGDPTPRMIDASSDISQVNYYRCDRCGAVWNIRKDDPDGPIHIVAAGTPPTKPE